MSEIKTGSVVGIDVIQYNAENDVTNNPDPNSGYYSPYKHARILDSLKSIKEVPVLNIKQDSGGFPLVERIQDLGITSSWYYAINCLAVRLYDGSVLFASISVEGILNHDLRLEELRKKKLNEWIDLNWKNLECAFCEGLPVKSLMNADDKFEKHGIEFVERRNKVAHGDVQGYHNMYQGTFDGSDYDPFNFDAGHKRPSEEHALDQISKAKNFIIEWANQKPKIRLH